MIGHLMLHVVTLGMIADICYAESYCSCHLFILLPRLLSLFLLQLGSSDNCGGAGVRSTAQYYKQTSSFGAGTIGTKIFRRKGFGISCQLGLSLLRQKIDAEKMSECPSLQHFLLHFTCVITEEDSFFPGISTSYRKIRTL